MSAHTVAYTKACTQGQRVLCKPRRSGVFGRAFQMPSELADSAACLHCRAVALTAGAWNRHPRRLFPAQSSAAIRGAFMRCTTLRHTALPDRALRGIQMAQHVCAEGRDVPTPRPCPTGPKALFPQVSSRCISKSSRIPSRFRSPCKRRPCDAIRSFVDRGRREQAHASRPDLVDQTEQSNAPPRPAYQAPITVSSEKECAHMGKAVVPLGTRGSRWCGCTDSTTAPARRPRKAGRRIGRRTATVKKQRVEFLEITVICQTSEHCIDMRVAETKFAITDEHHSWTSPVSAPGSSPRLPEFGLQLDALHCPRK